MLSTLISTDVAPPPISIDLVDVQPPKSLGSLWRSESCQQFSSQKKRNFKSLKLIEAEAFTKHFSGVLRLELGSWEAPYVLGFAYNPTRLEPPMTIAH